VQPARQGPRPARTGCRRRALCGQPCRRTSTGPTPLAVVTGFDNYKLNAITSATLVAKLRARTALVRAAPSRRRRVSQHHDRGLAPACGGSDDRQLPRTATKVGLLPPGLVGPGLKVVPLTRRLFGEGPERAKTYPLVIASPNWSTTWTAYSSADVRVILTTGVNCADRASAARRTPSRKAGRGS